MNIKDLVIRATNHSVDQLFRNARAVPADRLEWSPLDQGRSVLNQLQECAYSASWALGLMEHRKFMDSPEMWEQLRKEQAALTTVDLCEAKCREMTAKLIQAIEAFPESEYEQTVALPFGGGMVMNMVEIMLIHQWNCDYHNAQICYIQTLYGDKEMH